MEISGRTGQRHAMVRVGAGFLHIREAPGFAAGPPDGSWQDAWAAMGRGRVQHLALLVPDAGAVTAIRERLIAAAIPLPDRQTMGDRTFVTTRDPDGLPVELTDWPEPG